MTTNRTTGLYVEVLQSDSDPSKARDTGIYVEVLGQEGDRGFARAEQAAVEVFHNSPIVALAAAVVQAGIEVVHNTPIVPNTAAVQHTVLEVMHEAVEPLLANAVQVGAEVFHDRTAARTNHVSVEVFARNRGTRYAKKPSVIILS